MKVFFQSGEVWIQDCKRADDFKSRLFGFMGRHEIHSNEGLLFPKCSSVHMWFMKTSLDVIMLRAISGSANHYTVVAVHSRLKAWRLLPVLHFKATDCLEVAPGQILKAGLRKGDRLCIV